MYVKPGIVIISQDTQVVFQVHHTFDIRWAFIFAFAAIGQYFVKIIGIETGAFIVGDGVKIVIFQFIKAVLEIRFFDCISFFANGAGGTQLNHAEKVPKTAAAG